MSDAYIEESKKRWYRSDGEQPNIEQIKLGCLQRIATATETMSLSYSRLISERDSALNSVEYCRQRADKLKRQIAGLRGAIGRMKRARIGGAA